MKVSSKAANSSAASSASLAAGIESPAPVDRTPEPPSGVVRRATVEDMPAVGRLFQKVFRNSDEAPSGESIAYMQRVFIAPPGRQPDISSLVNEGDDGEVNGFIGILAMPFLVDGAKRHAAFAGTLMVDRRARDPLIGARLLRAFQAGQQDITLSETANEVSQNMWRRLRGTVLSDYSLEWIRVFRPAGFVIASAAMTKPALERIRFMAAPFDYLAGRLTTFAPKAAGDMLTDRTIDDDTLVDMLIRFTAQYRVRPDWAAMDLKGMLADARRKSRYGEMFQYTVKRGETPIGIFVYHARPGGIGHVLQIAAAPGRMQDVVDRLFFHAAQRGLAGLRGRTQPALLEALLLKNCCFIHRSATVALSKDAVFAECVARGDAFINGLAGETWIRLIGDELK